MVMCAPYKQDLHSYFVGRDFKAWAQMAIFVMGPYLNEGQLKVLLSFTKVLNVMYHK